MRINYTKFIRIRTVLVIVILFCFTLNSISQRTVTTEKPFNFSGALSITNKGISTIPSYTLGKPAMIFSLYMGNKFTFEPEFRYGLNGKPWMVLLWGRYNLVDKDKFQMNVGLNPSLFFRDLSSISTDSVTDALVLQRSITADMNTGYHLTNTISLGTYYMYIRGIESFSSKNTHYLTFRINFHDIKIYKQLYVNFIPQCYYLKVDEEDGYFFSSSISLKRHGFPLSMHSQFSKKIQSGIIGASDFLWNVSLKYSFSNSFYKNLEND